MFISTSFYFIISKISTTNELTWFMNISEILLKKKRLIKKYKQFNPKANKLF